MKMCPKCGTHPLVSPLENKHVLCATCLSRHDLRFSGGGEDFEPDTFVAVAERRQAKRKKNPNYRPLKTHQPSNLIAVVKNTRRNNKRELELIWCRLFPNSRHHIRPDFNRPPTTVRIAEVPQQCRRLDRLITRLN